MFQYRERVGPFAAYSRTYMAMGCNLVSIPRKGWPLCGDASAAEAYPDTWSFNTAKGLAPLRPEKSRKNSKARAAVSIPRKGWPLCGTLTKEPKSKYWFCFNTAKGLAPLRPSYDLIVSDVYSLVSIPRKGWPLCGLMQPLLFLWAL